MSKGKWVKTTEYSTFIQWTFMWKEEGEKCLGPTVTVRWEFGAWNMYVDESLTFKLPVTKHFKEGKEALKAAQKFIKKHPKGW